MMITRWIPAAMLVSIVLFSSSTSIIVAANPIQATDDSPSPPSGSQWLLVHGTWGGSWIWYKIETLLRSEGLQVYTVDLTSHGIVDDTRTADSVRTIEDWASPLLNRLSNITGKVIVVTHSLGGAAVSLAMEMYPDKIEKAVFIAAVMPLSGQTVGHTPDDKLQQYVNNGVLKLTFADGMLSTATSMQMNLTAAKPVFFTRVPKEDFILIENLVTPFPYGPFLEILTLTDEKYGTVPRYYIKCGLDNVISPAAQQKICDMNPPKVQFSLKNGDHAPMFSEAPYLFFMLKSIQKSN